MSLRLLGVFDFDDWHLFGEEQLTFIASKKANAVVKAFYLDWWNNNTNLNGVGYRDFWTRFSQWCTSHNIKLILACHGTTANPPDWNAMKYNAVYNPTDRATWINGFKSMIQTLQPYAVNPMNEPPDSIAPSDLKNFYLACIDAWTPVRTGLAVVIQGSPWWNIASILTSPRVDQSRPNTTVYYSTHYYYSSDGSVPQPSWGAAEMVAYWNGDLANAKTLLYNRLLNTNGVQAALNAGVNIIFEEVGGNINNPNVLQFEQDLFDFCKTRNISITYCGWWISGSGFAGTGLLSNWAPTLNAAGQVWALNMAVTPPPPSGKTYVFDHWIINGQTVTANPLQLTISAPVTIQAVYTEKVVTRTLTVSTYPITGIPVTID